MLSAKLNDIFKTNKLVRLTHQEHIPASCSVCY